MDEVAQMFSKIARRYDRANHILSFNRDTFWRRELVKQADPKRGERLLDLCTGTGDVIFEFMKFCPNLQISGLDLSEEMLQVAHEKLRVFQDLSPAGGVRLVQGNALELPFGDNSFDIVTIAFGLRNLPDRARGLKEIYRVLAPSGRALLLEFSLPQSFVVRFGYLIYLRSLVPWLGGWLTGERGPYKYLQNSIVSFPDRAQILQELYEVGFRPVGYRDLTFGIATLYWGGKANC